MSVSASLEIIIGCESREKVSIEKIIQKLIFGGWSLNHRGKMSYLPISDNGMFNWIDEDVSFASLIKIVNIKEKLGELIGFTIVWQNENIGGEVLIDINSKLGLSFLFSLSINRKQIDQYKITDVNWYLTKLVPALDGDDLFVESFSFIENI